MKWSQDTKQAVQCITGQPQTHCEPQTQPVTLQTCSLGGPRKHKGRGGGQPGSFSLAPCPTWAAPWDPLVAALGSRPHDYSFTQVILNSWRPHGWEHARLPCPSPSPETCSSQTHVYWVSDAIHHRILCHPLLLLPSIFPSIKVFSNESALHIRRPKYWSFSFSISPSNEHSGLIPFRMDCWVSLPSKGLSRVFSNTTVQMTFRWMAFRWSPWSENGGAPEMRGRLVEQGSRHRHLGTGPAVAPWHPGPAFSTGPVETQPPKRCHYAPFKAEGLQLPPEVCLWERQGSEAKVESEGGERKKQALKRNDPASWKELRAYYQTG